MWRLLLSVAYWILTTSNMFALLRFSSVTPLHYFAEKAVRSSATFIALKSLIFFFIAILKLKLLNVQRLKAEGKL